jgi:hypothetical protein
VLDALRLGSDDQEAEVTAAKRDASLKARR